MIKYKYQQRKVTVMLILNFIACILVTVLMSLCISWSNAYLFYVIGHHEDGKPVLSYHCLTIPARIVAIGITFMSVALCAALWVYFITSILIIL